MDKSFGLDDVKALTALSVGMLVVITSSPFLSTSKIQRSRSNADVHYQGVQGGL